MKRTLLPVAAAALLLAGLASCKDDNAVSSGFSQAQLDSAVNARVDSITMQMEMRNDSLVNARAMVMADSMIAARKGGAVVTVPAKSGGTKPAGTGGVKAPPVAPPTIGNGKPVIGDSRNNNGNTIGNGKPKIGDQPNKNGTTIGNGKPKMGNK